MKENLTENHHADLFRLPLHDSVYQRESVFFLNGGYTDGKRIEAFLFSRIFYISFIGVKSTYAYCFIDQFFALWLGEKS